jgi:hypothetical protein
MLGYIDQASVLIPEHVDQESVLLVLVRCWELAAANTLGAERLPGPPHLTIEDYHVPAGDRTGLKLVAVSGPAWLTAGEN